MEVCVKVNLKNTKMYKAVKEVGKFAVIIIFVIIPAMLYAFFTI